MLCLQVTTSDYICFLGVAIGIPLFMLWWATRHMGTHVVWAVNVACSSWGHTRSTIPVAWAVANMPVELTGGAWWISHTGCKDSWCATIVLAARSVGRTSRRYSHDLRYLHCAR